MAAVAFTPPQSRRTTILAAVVAVVVGLGVAWGSALAMQLAGPGGGAAGGSGAHHINDPVPTSFGTVGVEFVRSVDGVSHRALSGASHGVSGLVDDAHAQIQTAVSLTNDLDKPVNFDTRQFRLLITAKGKTTTQTAATGDLPNTRILPHAAIQGHLSFVVPRSGSQLALEFTDPGTAKPILIQLGDAEFGPQPESSHSH
jgi:hypothetical protein